MPLLSVITINLNNADGLDKTISSLKEQSFPDLEYIVIDGASSDHSADILVKHKQFINKVVCEKDSGIYNAMNKGIDLCSGEYILFLNSGDVLCSGILNKIRNELNESEIVYGDLVTIDQEGKKEQHRSFDKIGVDELLLSTIWHPCTFFKRSVFETCGKYDESFRLAGDYEFYVRSILKKGLSNRHIPYFISEFSLDGLSNRKSNQDLMNSERELAWKKNFSDVMVRFFKRSLTLKRSREYRIGKLITRFLPV